MHEPFVGRASEFFRDVLREQAEGGEEFTADPDAGYYRLAKLDPTMELRLDRYAVTAAM